MTCPVCGRACEVRDDLVFRTPTRQWRIIAPLYFAAPVPAVQAAVVPFCGAACSLAWMEGQRAAA